jgi:hypothetical protein
MLQAWTQQSAKLGQTAASDDGVHHVIGHVLNIKLTASIGMAHAVSHPSKASAYAYAAPDAGSAFSS